MSEKEIKSYINELLDMYWKMKPTNYELTNNDAEIIEEIINLIDKLQKELKDSINARFELQRRVDKLEQENKELNKAYIVFDDQNRKLNKKLIWLEQKNKDLEVTCNCQLQEIDTLQFVIKERRRKIKNKIKELETLRQGTETLSYDYLQLLGGIKYLEELLEEGIDSE